MNMPKAHTWLLVAVFALISNPLRAAETWYCEYSNYRQTDKHQSWFHVEGNRLVENSGDVIVDYQLLEDSKAAIVAAKGGSYAS